MYTALVNYCKENNVRCLINEPLYKHTTFRIGGNADVFVYANSSKTLSGILKILNENTIPFIIIGKGSNLLVNDNGVRGVVVSLEEMKSITLNGDIITAQSGAHLISLCTFAAENSLKGLEFAYGIPASVGGAQVSEKHAGFIINKNGATCSDVLSLIERVKQTVLKNNGVELEREVILINEDLSKS